MSQLIFRAWHNPETGKSLGEDDILATFDGSPEATLGLAVAFFNDKREKQHRRIVNGEYPNTPQMMIDIAKKFLATPIGERCEYRVWQFEGGFKIAYSDGPDIYELVD